MVPLSSFLGVIAHCFDGTDVPLLSPIVATSDDHQQTFSEVCDEFAQMIHLRLKACEGELHGPRWWS